jgi:hypothetical protein
MLSIQIPNNLEQQLNLYCQEHQISINETIRLVLERLLTTANNPLSPYELGKDGFGADQTHEGETAQNSKKLQKTALQMAIQKKKYNKQEMLNKISYQGTPTDSQNIDDLIYL